MNATTANPTFIAATESGVNNTTGTLWFGLAWCAQTARALAWGTAGLIAALASYAFGLGALIFGVLGHLQTEAQWWPAALCLFFGYLSVRGAVACMELAFRSRPGRFEVSNAHEH